MWWWSRRKSLHRIMPAVISCVWRLLSALPRQLKVSRRIVHF